MQFFFLLFAPTKQSTTYGDATTEASPVAGKSKFVSFEDDFSEEMRNYVN